jgi:hypothetical protein
MSSSLLSCQVVVDGKVVFPWTIHCDYTIECTLGELFETIQSNDSGAFAKYVVENYAVEAFIGKSKVESDEILLNCKVRDAIATFGRYVKFVMNPHRDSVFTTNFDRGRF